MASISYYYQQIAKLEALKKRFIALQNDLNALIPDLRKASTFLNDAVDGMRVSYTVNEVTADNDSIKDNKESVDDMISTISGSVMPAISEKIRSIEAEISHYYELIRQAEAEERERERNGNN